jgi:PAS domain S-box-containing protein
MARDSEQDSPGIESRERGESVSPENVLNAVHALGPGVTFRRVLGRDGEVSYGAVDGAVREVFGVDDPTFQIDWIHSEDRASYEDSFRVSSEQCRAWRREFRVLDATGEVHWVLGGARPVRTPEGDTVWDIVLLDITDRKLIEIDHIDLARRSRDFMRIASDWFWETDADHKFSAYFGGDPYASAPHPQYAIGKSRINKSTAEDRRRNPTKWREFLETIDSHKPFRDFTYAADTGAGQKLWVRTSGIPVFDAAGGFVGYRGVATDITDTMYAQQLVDASQNQLVSAIDGLSDRIVMFDSDDRLSIANRTWWEEQKRFGVGPAIGDFYGDYVRELAFSGNIAAAVGCEEEWIARRLERRGLPGQTIEMTLTDGEVVLVRDHRLRDGGILTITSTVTERVQAERALVASERRYRNLAENSLQGLLVHAAGKPLYANQAFARILGFADPEEVLSLTNIEATIAPEDEERLRGYQARRMRGEPAPTTYEYQAIRPDGTHVILESTNNKIDWDGSPAIQSIVYDITKRKEAEAAARASDLRFRGLLEQSVQGMWIRQDNLIVFANPALAELFDYDSPGEILGLDLVETLVAPRERDRIRDYNKARAEGREAPTHYEFRGLKKSGAELWLENRVQEVQWNNRPAVLAMTTDVGARKRAEAAVLHAKDEAEAANRAKSEFLSSMSHELRTPLNAVIGFSQLLADDEDNPLNDLQREAVGHIRAGGRHLLALISELLDLARIESGNIALSLEKLDARAHLRDTLDFARPVADEQGVSLSFENRSENMNSPMVIADPKKLRQILLNLITNAIKFNRPNGDVTVCCERVSGDMIRLSVADTGRGVPTDMQARLFEPFDRLGVEASEVEGTGIGLSITKRLVEKMNGVIAFESVEGRGSTFWVDLPAVESADALRSQTRADGPKIGGDGDIEHEKPATSTVLYIEDNIANADLMQAFIDGIPGVALVHATTAELGIDCVADEEPGIILMDLSLPGIDGFEAHERLRANAGTGDIPVIALTADATAWTADRCRDAGFRATITKPIDFGKLKTILAEYIGC